MGCSKTSCKREVQGYTTLLQETRKIPNKPSDSHLKEQEEEQEQIYLKVKMRMDMIKIRVEINDIFEMTIERAVKLS